MPVRLILGKTRRRRLSAVPPLGASGLLVVDSQRARRALQDGARGLVPRVRLVGELIDELWLRYGDGRALPSPRVLRLVAERVLTEGDLPWLAALGTPRERGAALARVAAQLDEADGVSLPDDLVLRRALDRLATALARRGLVRRGEAMRLLLERLPGPDGALPDGLLARALSRPGAVLLDELLSPPPLRAAVLLGLIRGWSRSGVDVVVTLASGQDLGGREAGAFFEYDDADGYPLKAFAAARSWRRALFSLVETGEADILVATGAGLLPVGPGAPTLDPEPPDLADRIYGQGPLVPKPPTLTLRQVSDPHEELRLAAAELKAALQAGAPAAILAVAGLRGREGEVQAVLRDFGVPHTLSAGRPLSASPIAQAALRVARLPALLAGDIPSDERPAAALLQLLDQLELPLPIPAHTLRRWCRAAGIRSADPRAWRDPLAAWLARERRPHEIPDLQPALEAVHAWVERLLPLAEAADPQTWRARLLEALVALGLPARVGQEPVALSAWGALLRALDALTLDLLAASPDPWPAGELAEHLALTLAETSWQPEPPVPGTVEVVDAADLRGPLPGEEGALVLVIGLSRRAFGHGRSPDGLLPRALARRLQPVDPLAASRYLLGAWIREATAGLRLTLSWPATVDDRPAPPAAAMADLLAVCDAIDAPPRDLPALARSDALRRAAEAPPWLTLVHPAQRDLAHAQRAAHLARQAAAFGPWDAILSRPPPAPATLAVTALETYLRCPARYWLTRVLGLRPVEDWSPELEPRRRGTVLHRILEGFVVERELKPLSGLAGAERAEAARHLHRVASEALDELEREGGFEPALQAWVRARWLAGLVDDAPAGLLAAWLAAEVDGPPLVPVAAEQPFTHLPLGPLSLRGSLDRLDRLPSGGLLVTDYKTGLAPSGRQVRAGLALQPVAYAEAVARAYPDTAVAAVYLELRRPDALRRAGWCGDPEVLDAACPGPARPHALELDATSRRQFLDRAARQAEALVAGHFPTTLHGPADAGCETCPVRRVCRVDHGRNRRIAAALEDAPSEDPCAC